MPLMRSALAHPWTLTELADDVHLSIIVAAHPALHLGGRATSDFLLDPRSPQGAGDGAASSRGLPRSAGRRRTPQR